MFLKASFSIHSGQRTNEMAHASSPRVMTATAPTPPILGNRKYFETNPNLSEIRRWLDGNVVKEKLEAMKRLIAVSITI
jgi:hypothetical protein